MSAKSRSSSRTGAPPGRSTGTRSRRTRPRSPTRRAGRGCGQTLDRPLTRGRGRLCAARARRQYGAAATAARWCGTAAPSRQPRRRGRQGCRLWPPRTVRRPDQKSARVVTLRPSRDGSAAMGRARRPADGGRPSRSRGPLPSSSRSSGGFGRSRHRRGVAETCRPRAGPAVPA